MLARLRELLLQLRAALFGRQHLERIRVRAVRDNLQRHRSAGSRVRREKHQGHAAPANFFDLVRSDLEQTVLIGPRAAGAAAGGRLASARTLTSCRSSGSAACVFEADERLGIDAVKDVPQPRRPRHLHDERRARARTCRFG